MTLPVWLKKNEKGVFEVNPDIAYPEVMKALGIDPKKLDQYLMEVVYQCTKLEVMRIVKIEEIDPRPDKVLVIDIKSNKEKWALTNFPKGKGLDVATKGREAREYYIKWRGFIPQ